MLEGFVDSVPGSMAPCIVFVIVILPLPLATRRCPLDEVPSLFLGEPLGLLRPLLRGVEPSKDGSMPSLPVDRPIE